MLATRTYAACKGGATTLATYVVTNTTGNARGIPYVADYVRNWQVCVKQKRKRKFSRKCLLIFFLKGILIEAIVTFVLVTVILMVALDTKSKTGLAPLLIGFALAVNILAV